jgi:hypothetical protein
LTDPETLDTVEEVTPMPKKEHDKRDIKKDNKPDR